MKRALVFYLYGTKNAGDMAICTGAAEMLKNQGFTITMVSRFSEHENEYLRSKEYIQSYYPDIQVIPGPFSFERNFSKIRKLGSYAQGLLKITGILPEKELKKLIAEHDCIFFNGGNLLRGKTAADYLRLAALFYPIELAKRMGKPVWCLPQSSADVSKTGRFLLSRYLDGMKMLYVREELSYNYLKSLFPKVPFTKSTDLAFFCSDTNQAKNIYTAKYAKMLEKGSTALVLRGSGIGDIGQLDNETRDRLLDEMELYIKAHPEKHYWIIVQTLKDRDIAKMFYEKVRGTADIHMIEDHDPLVLREIYRRMELTLTMRLHAGILSLSALTPVIGLFSEKWGLKNPGILSHYGMPYLIAEKDSRNINRVIEETPPGNPEMIQERIASELRKFHITGM